MLSPYKLVGSIAAATLMVSTPACASTNRLRVLRGVTGTPTPTPTVIPANQTVYMGALTLPGQGPNIQYTGTPGHLSIISATGNGGTMMRLNGCSQLVRGGNVTATLNGVSVTNAGYAHEITNADLADYTRAPGTLASTYDFTVQDSDTGQTGNIHLVTSGNYTVAGETVSRPVQGNGFVRTFTQVIPDHTIDLAHTRTISAFPTDTTACPGVANDYPNQRNSTFTTSGGYSADSLSSTFNDFPVSVAVGDTYLLEAGNYNTPYNNPSYPGGTIDQAVRVFMIQPTGTFSGTAPDYDDGNWVNVLFKDRHNTHMGDYQFIPTGTPSYVSFEGGIWDATRADLVSIPLGTAGQSAYGSSSSQLYGALFIGLQAGGDASNGWGSYIRVIDNVFDPTLAPSQTVQSADNFQAGLNMRLDGFSVSDTIIVKNNLFEHRFAAVQQKGNASAYTTNFRFENNYISGLGIDDAIDSANTCAYNMTGNYIAGSAVPAGSHPDMLQATSGGNTGGAVCPLFGTIAQNVLNTDDYGVDGTGNPAPGYRLSTDESAQALFLDAVQFTTLTRSNATITNNTYVGSLANCVALSNFDTVKVDHNSCILDLATTGPEVLIPNLVLNTGTSNVTATNNFISAGAVSDGGGGTGNTYNTTTNKNILGVQSSYSTYFNNPDTTHSCHTYACVITAWRAKVSGPLDGTATNGTAIGAVDTTGGFPTGP